MSERVELVVLPAIAGHAHSLDADGRVTCGCLPRMRAFWLPSTIVRAATLRPELRVTSSKCDVGADVPGGGAA